MDLKGLNQIQLNELLHLLTILLSKDARVFSPFLSEKVITFTIRDIRFLNMSTNGFPNSNVMPHLKFNWKDWFIFIEKLGVIIIDSKNQPNSFYPWSITASSFGINSLLVDVRNKLIKNAQQGYENDIEIKIRDIIRDHPDLAFPLFNSKGILNLPNPDELKMRKKEIDLCGECDIVCKLNNKIVNFIEITTGPITNDYPNRRILKRKKIAPEAGIWIIGAFIHPLVFEKTKELDAKIILLKDLKEKYPNLFGFLNV